MTLVEHLYEQCGNDPRAVASMSEEDLTKAQSEISTELAQRHNLAPTLDTGNLSASDPRIRASNKVTGERAAGKMV